MHGPLRAVRFVSRHRYAGAGEKGRDELRPIPIQHPVERPGTPPAGKADVQGQTDGVFSEVRVLRGSEAVKKGER